MGRRDQIIYWQQFIDDGNLDSLSKIYFHYYDLLYDYGLRMTPDESAVEDAIQTGFLNLIKQRKSIGKVINLDAYLITSFRRQLLSDLNKQRRLVTSEFTNEEHFDYFKTHDTDSSDHQNSERIHRIIQTCIENLTDKQKEIVYLRFQKEVPYETISEMLNISVDSCYKSLYRSINIIRAEVEKELEEEEA